MSQLLNTFELNLTSATEILKDSFDTNLLTETSLTPYTTTFTNVDNIDVSSQSFRYGSIGNIKFFFGAMDVLSTQINQIWGHHTISIPPNFFTVIPTLSLTMSNNPEYLVSAHAGLFDYIGGTLEIYYNQGIAPTTPGAGFVNILIIGI